MFIEQNHQIQENKATLRVNSRAPTFVMELIDSHCHFDFETFDKDRTDVWRACQQKGITKLIIPGTEVQQWRKAQSICEQNTGMYYAIGLHPYFLKNETILDTLPTKEIQSQIHHQTESKYCIAIGECGLDKRVEPPLSKQIETLKKHIELAIYFDLPLIIHCVKAHNELITTLKNFSNIRGVIHAFSGSYEMAMQYIEMGFKLGIGGTITYSRAKKTRDAISRVPLSSLLLESDAPDMPISGKQGQRNSPEYLNEIAQCLAELREDSLDMLTSATTHNTSELFNLPQD